MVRKARGRPPEYDYDTALQRAMQLFWERGYDAASLEDLGAAMEMSRPSMYAAFGDKRELFVKALTFYRDAGQRARDQLLDVEQPLHASLRVLFVAILDAYLSGEHGPRGCLMFTVAAAEAPRDPVVRALLADASRATREAFTARFEVARERGEIASAASPAALGHLALGLVHTLAVRACAGEKKRSLRAVIDAFLDVVLAVY